MVTISLDPTEHQLQVQCLEWFRLQYSGTIIFSTPNGATMTKQMAKKMKREGMMRGVPDLIIPVARGGNFGLWIEMKKKGQRPRTEQNEFMNTLNTCGYLATWVDTFDDFMAIVKKYMMKPPTVPKACPR